MQDSFLDRTLRGAWRAIARVVTGKSGQLVRPELPDEDIPWITTEIRDCVEARVGEVSARARAANLGHTYLSLNVEGRKRFLGVLAREVNVDPGPVDEAIEAVQGASDGEARRRAERDLWEVLQPPRFTLYKRFSTLPEGVKFLVGLRADLLTFYKQDSALEVPEAELKSLLASWFDVGLLELSRIGWDSSAALLEKLIEYEAVHQIDGWDDLKNRLRSDRRCFAFFHPRMPNEPLIFVEVALVNGMAGNVQALLDPEAPVVDPRHADTAIFYSISNAQKGLVGISFGDFLIKRVVDVLASEFRALRIFATLSSVPGFRKWINDTLIASGPEIELLTETEREELGPLYSGLGDADRLNSLLLDYATDFL